MKNEFPFRRGGFGGEPNPPLSPAPEKFVQVPEHFTRGLSPEQWRAWQETYRIAWEKARRDLGAAGSAWEGAGNYEI